MGTTKHGETGGSTKHEIRRSPPNLNHVGLRRDAADAYGIVVGDVPRDNEIDLADLIEGHFEMLGAIASVYWVADCGSSRKRSMIL